jgi:hypothetical protein
MKTDFFADSKSFTLMGAFDVDGFVPQACHIEPYVNDSESFSSYVSSAPHILQGHLPHAKMRFARTLL